MEARLPSRRIAYFIFLIFAYIVYTFYTSNLLSHLVSDKKEDITLASLATIDLECVIVDYMLPTVLENVPSYNNNYTYIIKKLRKLRAVTVEEGLQGIKAGKMAMLSDYTGLYPFAKAFSSQEICEITNVDLFSNIKKYFFASKHFPYKEELKIGTLRIKETGILRRSLEITEHTIPKCEKSPLVQTKFVQISTPVLVLLLSYVFSLLILIIERVHYKRNKVWPYVE